MKHSIEIKVRGYHLDLFSHVNNARYLEFLEEARWSYFEKDNIFIEFITKNNLSFPLVNININYRNSAGLNDMLRVETYIKRVGSKSATLQQTINITNRNLLCVDAEVTFVMVDNRTGHAVELSHELLNAWSGTIEGK